jgi:hypothetical protein
LHTTKKILSLLKTAFAVLFFTSFAFSQPNIAILYSGLTQAQSDEQSQKIIEAITSLELFFMQDKISYKVIYDDDLKSGIADDFDILILPSVETINETEFNSLQEFLTNGKSIINLGSQLRNPLNESNEFYNLQTLFGLSNLKKLESEDLSFIHTLPLNIFWKSGTNDDGVLRISAKNHPLLIEAEKYDNFSSGFIISKTENHLNRTSIIQGTIGNGRFLWTGFGINDLAGGKEDNIEFQNLIKGAIEWMDNKPDVYLTNFPDSFSSPIILTIKYNNALEPELIDVLLSKKFTPHLIVDQGIKISQEILSRFNEDEIILDFSNSNLSDRDSSNSIKKYLGAFNLEYGFNIKTILVNKSAVKNIDAKYLREIDINKILILTEVCGLPEMESNGLLYIPYSDNQKYSKSNNGIQFINYIPKINCEKNTEDNLLTNLNLLSAQNYHFISLNRARDWWIVRNNLKCEIKLLLENSIEIFASNNNSVEVDNIKLFLNPGESFKQNGFSITSNNTPLDYYYEKSNGAIVINLNKLYPNSVKKILISFSEN